MITDAYGKETSHEYCEICQKVVKPTNTFMLAACIDCKISEDKRNESISQNYNFAVQHNFIPLKVKVLIQGLKVLFFLEVRP